jgi:hypothetical protein
LLARGDQDGDECAVSACPQGLAQGRSWHGKSLRKMEQNR